MPERERTIVSRIVLDKGFGFARSSAHNVDVFFHRSACVGVEFEALSEGDAISIEPCKGPKGWRTDYVGAV